MMANTLRAFPAEFSLRLLDWLSCSQIAAQKDFYPSVMLLSFRNAFILV